MTRSRWFRREAIIPARSNNPPSSRYFPRPGVVSTAPDNAKLSASNPERCDLRHNFPYPLPDHARL
jgi:hypothetical protein